VLEGLCVVRFAWILSIWGRGGVLEEGNGVIFEGERGRELVARLRSGVLCGNTGR